MEDFGPVQVEVGGHRVEATEQGRADGQRHGDGVRMSWHRAVFTPARWSPVTGVSRLERRIYQQSANGRSTYRSRPPPGIVDQPMGEGGAPIGLQPAHERHRGWESHRRTRNSPADGTA